MNNKFDICAAFVECVVVVAGMAVLCHAQQTTQQISSTNDLNELFTSLNEGEALTAHIELTNDLVFDDETSKFAPFGKNKSNAFSGTFDGRGFKVSGLNVEATSKDDDAGMFWKIVDGTVQNVLFDETCSFVGIGGEGKDGSNVGVVSGQVCGSSLIDGVVNNAIVQDGRCVGGVVGKTTTCDDAVGGTPTFTNCVNNANTKTTGGWSSNVGGIVGFVETNTTIEHCTNTGNVSATDATGNAFVGGIVGAFQNDVSQETINLNISSCTNNGTINADTESTGSVVTGVGGVVGFTGGQLNIASSTNKGSVTSNSGNANCWAGLQLQSNHHDKHSKRRHCQLTSSIMWFGLCIVQLFC